MSRCRFAFALVLPLSLPAVAQSNLSTPDVVVTASRFVQPRRDPAVGVTVITVEEIRASGALTLPEVLSRQTGFTVRDSSGSPNRQIDLRGFGITGDQNTLILVNGQRLSENETTPADLASISLASVERIEILRSSGAVLYGSGATGGTVNIITRGPQPGEHQGRVAATAGSYGTLGVSAGASLAGERLGLSVNAASLAADNYRVNNDLRQNNLSGEVTWFGDRGPVALRFASGNQDLRLPGARTEAQLQSDRRGATTPNDYLSLENSRVALSTTQALGAVEAALDMGHRERRSRSFQFDNFNDVNGRVTSVSPRVRVPFSLGPASSQLVAGLDWDEWQFDNRIASFGYFGTSTQRNLAGYFQDTLEFPTGTTVSVGARQQRVTTSLAEQSFGRQDASKERTVNAWEMALRQTLDEQWSAYGKAGRSFRIAVVDEIRGFGFVPPALLEPQISVDREIGLQWAKSGHRLRVAAFRSDLQNEIMYVPFAPPFGANVNLPPTRREGIELEGGVQLSPVLGIGGTYTFTNARFRSGSVGGVDVAGNDIPLVPRHRASVTLSWRPAEAWQANAVLTYVGTQVYDNDQANTFGRRMPAYTLLDLNAAWSGGPWTLRAALLNATGEKYYTYAIASGSSFSAYPAALRTLLLTAEYRFGR
jgi:iron complex outermembrane receptor protein